MGTLLQNTYNSIDGNVYSINVDLDSYNEPTFFEPNGRATVNYPEIKDILTVTRGCEMDVQLEIRPDQLQLLEILSQVSGDREARGKLFKNGQIIFDGWLRPDSLAYPLTTEYIYLNLAFTDGLGLLKGTEYRNPDGTQYRGKETELTQLTRVLQLTGSTLNFRIYDFEIYYNTENSAPGDILDRTPIDEIETDQNRYRSADQSNSVFDCEKVIEGILKKYGACIFQHANKWHIVKVARFFSSAAEDAINTTFKEYDSNGVLVETSNMDAENEQKIWNLGSQTGGYNPFFCNANQRLQYNGTIGAYKVLYKYGFLKSIITNSEVIFNNTAGSIDGWSIPQNSELIYQTTVNPLRAILKETPGAAQVVRLQTVIGTGPLIENDTNVSLNFRGYYIPQAFEFTIYAVKIELWDVNDQNNRRYLNNALNWITDSNAAVTLATASAANFGFQTNFSVDITTAPTPFEGNIYIKLLAPQIASGNPAGADTGILYEFAGAEPNILTPQITGESYTGRLNRPNLMAKNQIEEEIFVGDGDAEVYIGALTDTTDNATTSWQRRIGIGVNATQKALLEWLAFERVLMQLNNQTQFDGDLRGFVPYLSLLKFPEIDTQLDNSNYMITGYAYDTKTEQTQIKAIKISNPYEGANKASVEFNLESDEVVEPKIIG